MAKRTSVTHDKITRALDWAYETALSPPVPGLESCYSLAEAYKKPGTPLKQNARTLVNWQVAKCATTGFLTGLGGVLTLPIAIPADLGVTFFIQIRMIASIAVMAGLDVKDDRVRALVYACLTGDAAKELLAGVGVKVGQKITEKMIERISFEAIKSVNQKVGFRLLTKFGEKGLINLGKMVPLVGGIIGGTADAVFAKLVGKVAITVLCEDGAG